MLPHVDGRSGVALAELPAGALDARTVQGLVDSLAARESAATARVAAAALAAVLRDGFARGLVDELPPRVTLPPPPAGRERTLTLAETARLLEVAQADDAARGRSLLGPLVALLVASGCGVSEALALAWEQDGLDLAANPPAARIVRSTTKTTAGARRVPLDADTANLLRRHYLASGRPCVGAPVFADEHGRRLPRHGRVRFGLARVAEAAGLTERPTTGDGKRARRPLDYGAHIFRHAHASELAAAGVPAAVAAARLGHADGGALWLRTYAHPGAGDGDAALELAKLRKRDSATRWRSPGVQTSGDAE